MDFGKKKFFFVKLIYLIPQVFSAWFFKNFLAQATVAYKALLQSVLVLPTYLFLQRCCTFEGGGAFCVFWVF